MQKKSCERASNTLDLIAYVSHLDRDIFAGPQLRRPRWGKITDKNGETTAVAEMRRRWRGTERIMTRWRTFPRYLCAVGGAPRVLYLSKLLLAICLPSGLARERIPYGLIDRSVADQRLIIDAKPKRCRGSFENLGRIPRASRLAKKRIWRDRFSLFEIYRVMANTLLVWRWCGKRIHRLICSQACDCLGVSKECDYFGLKYQNAKGEELWLNLRNPIERQTGGGVAPLRFALRVKFWVPPHLLLQEATR